MPRGVYDRKREQPQEAARGANPPPAAGRAEVSAPACLDCRYFDPDITAEGKLPTGEIEHYRIGYCVRYPTPVRKRANHWCGEFQPRGARS
jgi:hypothetical protein